jgi:hypothetical protein
MPVFCRRITAQSRTLRSFPEAVRCICNSTGDYPGLYTAINVRLLVEIDQAKHQIPSIKQPDASRARSQDAANQRRYLSNGVVVLSGSADSLSSSNRAEALAGAVTGVNRVDNRLVLKSPG